ncbi:MAG: carbohydrate ABC transporter permease [bacterium]|nr:carbohydrate ABC transporter permease [bacterium]
MKSKMKKRKISVFEEFNLLLLGGFCLLVLLPFLHVVSLSFSSPESSFAQIRFIPEKFTLQNYVQVFKNKYIYSGFANSIFRTVVGTFLSVLATVCAAYPLSKTYFPHKTFWTLFIVFTMFFSAGLIPTYLWNKQLGLMDNKLVLILPGLISAYNVVIARNFFMGIPESLEESAKIDGANDILIFFQIVAPISKAIIATLALWIAVGHWNAWFDSTLYIRDAGDQVLQVVMRRIVLEGQIAAMELDDPNLASAANPETIKAATIMVTTLPILCVYPFVQKHFVKGVVVGSVKG